MTRTSKWRGWSFIGAAALASTLGVRTMQAQYNPIAFGIVAGASIPVGDFSDGAEIGWHAGALIEWRGPSLPVGVRGEAVYHRFASKDDGSDIDGHASIIAGTLNAVLAMPMQGATAQPYLIGGVGVYNERVSCDDCAGSGVDISDSQTKFGLNAGAGVSFPLSGFTSIIEARFHIVFDSEDIPGENNDASNTMFIPISVGLLFR
ncbi:MAG: outer membrane beta-barrel protein [Gemmatimonadaceae bacterium]